MEGGRRAATAAAANQSNFTSGIEIDSVDSTKKKKKSPKRQKSVLIDFLHPGSVFVVVALQRRHVVDVEVVDLHHIGGVGVLVETQAQLHHAVNATGVDLRVFEAEPGGEEE